MDIKKEFYSKLPSDKIKINWNKSPVKMDGFLAFLTVSVVRSTKHFGSDTGWTLLENEELDLQIKGGIINGIEYLDSLQFGTKLSNPYNNYVNPFYLWEILNDEGRKFFVYYYSDDISKLISNVERKIESMQNKLTALKDTHEGMVKEANSLRNNSITTTFTPTSG